MVKYYGQIDYKVTKVTVISEVLSSTVLDNTYFCFCRLLRCDLFEDDLIAIIAHVSPSFFVVVKSKGYNTSSD